jgi:hypothetical protein
MGGATVFADTWPRRFIVMVCGKGYKMSPSAKSSGDGRRRLALSTVCAYGRPRLVLTGDWRLEDSRRWPPWIFPADAS